MRDDIILQNLFPETVIIYQTASQQKLWNESDKRISKRWRKCEYVRKDIFDAAVLEKAKQLITETARV